MKTNRLCALAAALMLGTVLSACDRKPDSPPATTSPPGTTTRPAEPPATTVPSTPPATTTPSAPPISSPDTGTTPGTNSPGTKTPAPGSSLEDDRGRTTITQQSPDPAFDRTFFAAASSSARAQTAAGRLVAADGANPRLRDFADRVQQEQSLVELQLSRLAAERNLDVDESTSGAVVMDLAEMRQTTGAKLDSLFIARFGSAAQNDAIALFEREAQEGSDPELRAFAASTLPVLRRHLDTARSLELKLASGR